MVLNQKEIDTQNFVAHHYENTRYKVGYSIIYHDWWSRQMLKLIHPYGRILDNGCGPGHFAAKWLKGKDVIGLDIAEEMVKYAKTRMDNVVQGDSQELPFEDESFDTIFARGLIHHLPEPEKGVSEMYRTLKPGGRVLFVEPISSVLSRLPRKIANKKSDHFSEDHKNFERKKLIKIISKHFEIQKIRPFGYLAYPLLGFPDVLSIYKYVPFKKIMTPLLIFIDNVFSKIPLIKNQAWGVMIVVKKSSKNYEER